MEKYEELWKKKKSAIAKQIVKSANAPSAYSYAKELAEMELSENQNELGVFESKEPHDSIETLFMEFSNVAKPVADFLRENFNPHAAVVITDSFAKIVTDEVGMPLEEEEE